MGLISKMHPLLGYLLATGFQPAVLRSAFCTSLPFPCDLKSRKESMDVPSLMTVTIHHSLPDQCTRLSGSAKLCRKLHSTLFFQTYSNPEKIPNSSTGDRRIHPLAQHQPYDLYWTGDKPLPRVLSSKRVEVLPNTEEFLLHFHESDYRDELIF